MEAVTGQTGYAKMPAGPRGRLRFGSTTPGAQNYASSPMFSP